MFKGIVELKVFCNFVKQKGFFDIMVMNKWSGVETGIQNRLKICCPLGVWVRSPPGLQKKIERNFGRLKKIIYLCKTNKEKRFFEILKILWL